jgi:hypothetical protein
VVAPTPILERPRLVTTRERLVEDFCDLFTVNDVLDVESPFFEVVSQEMVSDVDMLPPFIIWVSFGHRLGSLVVCEEDRRWQFD